MICLFTKKKKNGNDLHASIKVPGDSIFLKFPQKEYRKVYLLLLHRAFFLAAKCFFFQRPEPVEMCFIYYYYYAFTNKRHRNFNLFVIIFLYYFSSKHGKICQLKSLILKQVPIFLAFLHVFLIEIKTVLKNNTSNKF